MKITLGNLWMDGYETEEEMNAAILEYLLEALQNSCISAKILSYEHS